MEIKKLFVLMTTLVMLGAILVVPVSATTAVIEETELAKTTTKVLEGGVAGDVADTDTYDLMSNVDSMITSGLTDTEFKDYFLDKQITFNDNDYDIKEQLDYGTNFMIQVAGSSSGDKEFGLDPYLVTLNEEAMYYCYKFDDNIASGDIGTSETLDIELLGESFKITHYNCTASQDMTYKTGDETTLGVGDTYSVEGKTVTVKSIGESKVHFDVDGESDMLGETDGATEVEDTGIEIDVQDILYTDDVESREVQVWIAEDISKNVAHGESIEDAWGGDEPEQETLADWVWDLDGCSSSSLQEICVTHNQKYNNYDEEVKGVGEAFVFPNNYLSGQIDSVTDRDYRQYLLEFDEVDVYATAAATSPLDGGDTWAAIFTASSDGDDAFKTALSNETDEIVVRSGNATQGAYYAYYDHDHAKYVKEADIAEDGDKNAFDINYDDAVLSVNVKSLDNVTDYYTIDQGKGAEDTTDFGDIVVNVTQTESAEGYLGTSQDEEEGSEVKVDSTNIGTGVDGATDFLTGYGIKILDPEGNGASDDFKIEVPNDQVKATFSWYAGAAGGVAAIADDAATSAEVGDDYEVSIGGPAANSITADLMGLEYPTYGSDEALGWEPGWCHIKDYDGVTVIAGYSAEDTYNCVVEYASGTTSHDGVLA